MQRAGTGPDRTGPAGTEPDVLAAGRLQWGMAALGLAAALAAAVAAPTAARAAAAQDWPPFVLVAGLLLVGLVADQEGLFAAGGDALARAAPNGVVLYVGTAVLVVAVTTVLNLDTSVTFVTPVLVYAARRRGEGVAPLMYGCLLLSNAGSLMLPGANLTNLIVLGHLHLSGGAFLARMALPAFTAAVLTAVVVGLVHRRELRATVPPHGESRRPVLGVGLAAVVAVTLVVLTVRAPVAPVAVATVGVVAIALGARRNGAAVSPEAVLRVLGLPLLVGLFGCAVALGTLGRSWSGPATALGHLDSWGTVALSALAAVAVNNLPAASLLAAHRPPHPFSLLIGLNVGPNLFVTGSLAWVLWLRAARAAGGRPRVGRASLLGLASAPLALAGAVAVLGAQGLH